MWAAAANNAEVVQALVEAGADIQARTKFKPVAVGGPGGLGRRAERNSDATKQAGFTALHFAVRAGSIDAVKALLKAGATVRDTTSDGTGVVVMAIASTHFELADWLVDQGADPNAAEQGWTPLHQIAYTRRPNTGVQQPWAGAQRQDRQPDACEEDSSPAARTPTSRRRRTRMSSTSDASG